MSKYSNLILSTNVVSKKQRSQLYQTYICTRGNTQRGNLIKPEVNALYWRSMKQMRCSMEMGLAGDGLGGTMGLKVCTVGVEIKARGGTISLRRER